MIYHTLDEWAAEYRLEPECISWLRHAHYEPLILDARLDDLLELYEQEQEGRP